MKKILMLIAAALVVTAGAPVALAESSSGPAAPKPHPPCRPGSSTQSPCCRNNPASPGCWDRAPEVDGDVRRR